MILWRCAEGCDAVTCSAQVNQIRFSKDGQLFFRTVSSGGVEVRDLPLTFSEMRKLQEPQSMTCKSTLTQTGSCRSHSNSSYSCSSYYYSPRRYAGFTLSLPSGQQYQKAASLLAASEETPLLPHQVYSFPELEKLHVLMGHTAATYTLDLSPSEGWAPLNLPVTQSLLDSYMQQIVAQDNYRLVHQTCKYCPTLNTLLG